MATLTVKNIPDRLYERIKQSAQAHRRSINSEILATLERALASHRRDADEVIARARALREQVAGPPVSDRELSAARRAGRA